ncbi:S8 family serine peptidase [Actinocrispum sp. NPDC049592]|uniref:S8 family peptidase n=1 Tax=Actinocrispum sp. NPDC049592 TaxID=3154835 RepID=UPI0034188CCD
MKRCAASVIVAMIATLAGGTPVRADSPLVAPVQRDTGAVTLITGDRVIVTAEHQIVFRRGPGREGIPYTRKVVAGKVSVVPFDAERLLASGALDPKLFDITDLLATRDRAVLPLIVRYRAPGSRKLKGAQVKRELPSINAVAMSVRQADTAGFWKSINPQAPMQADRLPAGVERISLDGTARPLDVESVKQIQAPAAWRRGLTAKGVKVAVLDTGVDAKHPDIAGRIVETRDFTDSSDGVKDSIGHGTHVAGIIAGTGPQPGVAPGATLMIGRVCADTSCEDSAIIAGMEWAAKSGAKVVNLSLGGDPTDGTDELSQALNTLSEKYGTLFVVAAGNSGAAGTVSAPGSADAALTVGSVTKDGQLSFFSSRGPRVGDFAVKPEITAPGYAITAARAAGTNLGLPLDDRYTQASGTSMATPHVTAAAAIVAGQHPGWTPAQIKAALVSTADPVDGAEVVEQGVGTVNLDRSTGQQVYASPATVNLSRTPTGVITYRNDSGQPVHLTLNAPNGIKLDRHEVLLPARGEAKVTVTAKSANDNGALITARAGQTVVRTAVSAHRAVTSQHIVVNAIDRNGEQNGKGFGFSVVLANHDTREYYLGFVADGRALSSDVPQGRYTVFSWIPSANPARPPWEPAFTLVAKEVTLDHDIETTLDGRAAGQVAITLNDTEGTGPVGMAFGMTGMNPWAMQSVDETYVVPATTPGMVYTQAQYVRGVVGSTTCGPDGVSVCNIGFASDDKIALDHPVISDRDLAAVRGSYGAANGTGTADRVDFAHRPGAVSAPPAEPIKDDEITLPGTLMSYFHSTGPVEWLSGLFQTSPVFAQAQGQRGRPYTASSKYEETWLSGVFGPAVSAHPVSRNGNLIDAPLPLMSDPIAGRYGYVSSWDGEGRTELYRDGTLVTGELSPDGSVFQVPPDRSRYRLVARGSRDAETSTVVEAAWEFQSQSTRDATELPMLSVMFAPELDETGSAQAGRAVLVPLTIDRSRTASTVRNVTVEVSFDDGSQWTNVPVVVVGDRGVALIHHPNGAGFVSLRASARDTHGNTVSQKIMRAYRLRPRSP